MRPLPDIALAIPQSTHAARTSANNIQIRSRIQSPKRKFFQRIAKFFLNNEIQNAASAATLTSLLAASAAPALIDRGRSVSFRELADESSRVAQGLRALEVHAGDRVALWLPNVPAWLAAFFACARIGAIAVAVNTRFRSAEL